MASTSMTSPALPASRSSSTWSARPGGVEFDLTGPGGYTAFTQPSAEFRPDHPALQRQLRPDRPRQRRTGRLLRVRARADVGHRPHAGNALQRHPGRQRPGPALRGERAHRRSRSWSRSRTAPRATSTRSTPSSAHRRPSGNYDYRVFANGVSANQQLLVPSAAPGTWYILVYSVSVAVGQHASPSRPPGRQITPDQRSPRPSRGGKHATLTLTGSGSTTRPSVELVSTANTVYTRQQRVARHVHATDRHVRPEQRAAGDLFGRGDQPRRSELRAGGGVHRHGRRDRQSGHPPDPAQRDGPPHRFDDLRRVLQHGQRGHAGPALCARIVTAGEQAAVHAQPRAVVSGFWTSAIPQGYSNTVEILASGKVPGVLEPGESVTVPVYYAGMQAALLVRQDLEVRPSRLHPERLHRPSIGAACKRASSRRASRTRPGRPSTAA